jgi:hypothetical protein
VGARGLALKQKGVKNPHKIAHAVIDKKYGNILYNKLVGKGK